MWNWSQADEAVRNNGGAVYRSENAGRSWTKSTVSLLDTTATQRASAGGGPATGVIKGFHFSPAFAMDQTVLLTGYNLGVQLSLNRGKDFVVVHSVGAHRTATLYIILDDNCDLRPLCL